MRKAQSKWVRLSRIWGREGDDAWTSCKFYKAVIQETLFFVLETLVMTPSIGRTLGGFHHKVDRFLEGMGAQSKKTGQC